MNSTFTRVASLTRRLLATIRRLPGRIHRCQGGAMSILSVFTVLFLTMLLGMVMNVGRQVDNKIRMQNAADAVAYSGTAALARGMNALAFSNHLLCEVMAMTAVLREGRDRHSDKYVPEILKAWSDPAGGGNDVASQFDKDNWAQFDSLTGEHIQQLGSTIRNEAQLEQQLVNAYTDWLYSMSVAYLPALEEILNQEMIPHYQQTLLQSWPSVAQMTANEVAKRNGLPNPDVPNSPDAKRGYMMGALWRSTGAAVSTDSWTLPAVDPSTDILYATEARTQREFLAKHYLNQWNHDILVFFEGDYGWPAMAQMCQFARLWRGFTCYQLKKLLDENYSRNLLFQIRKEATSVVSSPAAQNAMLDEYFNFVGVAYWKQVPDYVSGLFQNPLDSDSVTYAEAHLFVPKRKPVWVPKWDGGTRGSQSNGWLMGGSGGTGGKIVGWHPGRDGYVYVEYPPLYLPMTVDGDWHSSQVPCARDDWTLLNQNWTAQVVPAASSNLASILQTTPSLPEFSGASFKLPHLGNVSTSELQRISPH